MNEKKKALLIKYITCFTIAISITLIVIAIGGFFTDDIRVNIQLLADGFFTSGILFTLTSGMLYVINEGIFIGIGYVFKNVLLSFLPNGRAKQELYANYYERKINDKKLSNDLCILVTGLIFLVLSIVFVAIWQLQLL